jgi:hypothetical protein
VNRPAAPPDPPIRQLHFQRPFDDGRLTTVEVSERLLCGDPGHDGGQGDVGGAAVAPGDGELDGQRGPRRIPVAAVQVGAAQAAGEAGEDERPDHAMIGAQADGEVRALTGV